MKRTRRRSNTKPLLYIQSGKPPVVPITAQNIYRFRIEPEYEPVSIRPTVEAEKRKLQEKKEKPVAATETTPKYTEIKEKPIVEEEQKTTVVVEQRPSVKTEDVMEPVGVDEEQLTTSAIKEKVGQTMDAKSAIEELKKSAISESLIEETPVSDVEIGNRDEWPLANKTQVLQEPQPQNAGEGTKEGVEEEERELTEEEIRQIELKKLIRRLAVFPRVLERPYCEATIHGKKRIVQILSKRGNKVRVKYRNNQIEVYDIGDFDDLKILVGE